MVTFAFILVFILLGQLMLIVDLILFEYGYMEAFFMVFQSQGTADRYILLFTVLFALGWSIVTDVRRKKIQKKSKSLEMEEQS
ncbi:hypothetical protein [Niallia sp. Krafla_26]|uniref:hypothetical protein n=1 Tax=Niallia sp. Krafla_26 TaxID=3064703 RepID=UPI003D185C35